MSFIKTLILLVAAVAAKAFAADPHTSPFGKDRTLRPARRS